VALTTTVRLRLESKAFDTLFGHHEARYRGMVATAHKVMADQVPAGAQPTVDDMKKVLQPMVELDRDLRTHLVTRGCTQKYWVSDFTDYILDRVLQPTANVPAENN